MGHTLPVACCGLRLGACDTQGKELVSSFPRMESPVRSVETGENGGGGGGGNGGAGKDSQQSRSGAATGGGAPGPATQQQQVRIRLERQVEELSCADEDEAQEKVSKRLQFKQDQAQKKRLVEVVVVFSIERGRQKKESLR